MINRIFNLIIIIIDIGMMFTFLIPETNNKSLEDLNDEATPKTIGEENHEGELELTNV
jgi:hypothetical protein